MENKNYFEMINEVAREYNISINYNPADGTEVKHNFKYVDIKFNESNKTFTIETKKVELTNNQEMFKYIQELSRAGEIVEALQRV